MFSNCEADDKTNENPRMLLTLIGNKGNASLPLLLALYFCFVQINVPKISFFTNWFALCLYRLFSNRKLNANELHNAAICITMMCSSFS